MLFKGLKLKRKGKQFAASSGTSIAIYVDHEALGKPLQDYERVYAASWKIPEPYPEFIRGLCRSCADTHSLRLGIAYVDDQPVAAQASRTRKRHTCVRSAGHGTGELTSGSPGSRRNLPGVVAHRRAGGLHEARGCWRAGGSRAEASHGPE